jgi:hypothetical protein
MLLIHSPIKRHVSRLYFGRWCGQWHHEAPLLAVILAEMPELIELWIHIDVSTLIPPNLHVATKLTRLEWNMGYTAPMSPSAARNAMNHWIRWIVQATPNLTHLHFNHAGFSEIMGYSDFSAIAQALRKWQKLQSFSWFRSLRPLETDPSAVYTEAVRDALQDMPFLTDLDISPMTSAELACLSGSDRLTTRLVSLRMHVIDQDTAPLLAKFRKVQRLTHVNCYVNPTFLVYLTELTELHLCIGNAVDVDVLASSLSACTKLTSLDLDYINRYGYFQAALSHIHVSRMLTVLPALQTLRIAEASCVERLDFLKLVPQLTDLALHYLSRDIPADEWNHVCSLHRLQTLSLYAVTAFSPEFVASLQPGRHPSIRSLDIEGGGIAH